MNIQTAVEKIRDFIQTNLVDPISSRSSAWIYEDEMRVDLDMTSYPKILLKTLDTDAPKERLGIGEIGTVDSIPLLVMIKAKMGEHYGIGEENYTGKQFVAYIGNQLDDLIKSSGQSFIDLGFLHVIPTREKFTIDQDKNPIFNLTLELKYINTPE